MMKRYIILLSMVFILLVGCNADEGGKSGDAGGSELEPVKFVLDWTPNTNHTGIYVAKAKGFFEEEGLDVEIMLPGEAGAGQLIATGKADFGISYQESLTMARNENLPLVSVAAIIQHNTAGYASPIEKNITNPADFEGKVYGANISDLYKAIMTMSMEENGADFNKIDSTNIGESDFFVAIQRDIDFSLVFQAWTGIEAEIRGVDLNMIYLKDLSDSLDFYTPLIATNEKLIEDNPELAEKFIRAAVKGYEFAMEDPAGAADILIESVPDINEELVRRSQEWLADKYQDDADRFGIQETARWKKVTEFMIEHELIEPDFDYGAAFTNDFLPKE